MFTYMCIRLCVCECFIKRFDVTLIIMWTVSINSIQDPKQGSAYYSNEALRLLKVEVMHDCALNFALEIFVFIKQGSNCNSTFSFVNWNKALFNLKIFN